MRYLIIFLVLIFACGGVSISVATNSQGDPHEQDNGGDPYRYIIAAMLQRMKPGPTYPLRGVYSSAAVFRLMGNVCVSRTAFFRTHEIRTIPDGKTYAEGVRNDEATSRSTTSSTFRAALTNSSKAGTGLILENSFGSLVPRYMRPAKKQYPNAHRERPATRVAGRLVHAISLKIMDLKYSLPVFP